MKTRMILAMTVMFMVAVLAASGAWADTGVSNRISFRANDIPSATISMNTVVEIDGVAESYVAGTDTFALDVAGTGTGPYSYDWSSPDASADAAISDSTAQSPTINIGGLAAGTYTFSCNVTNAVGPMTSNTVTLMIYDHVTVLLTSIPPANPVAPLDGATEVNIPNPVVFTANASGGWGAVPAVALAFEMSTDGGATWDPVPIDANHVVDASVPNVLTLTIDPTVAIDTAIYQVTFDDGH